MCLSAPTAIGPTDKYADQRPWDGPFKGDPNELDYRCVDYCDNCGKKALGTMYHARGATGRVCPVLFIADCCSKSMS